MAEKNPEPAFPGAVNIAAPPGMSLRDYFAAQALPAIIAAASAGQHNAGALRELPANATMDLRISSDAFAMADAMLAARSK